MMNWFCDSLPLVSIEDSRKRKFGTIYYFFWWHSCWQCWQTFFGPFMFTFGLFKHTLRTKPMASRNLSFTRGNPKAKFSSKDEAKQNVHKFGQKDPIHIPDSHRDFYAQVMTLLQALLQIQKLNEVWMAVHNWWGEARQSLSSLFSNPFSWVIQWNVTKCSVYVCYFCKLS